MFGVGRSSIREAVKMLVNMGLVEVKQGAGTFVVERPANESVIDAKMMQADRTELDEVRRILDMAVAERAVARCTPDDVELMKIHLAARKEAAQAGDLERCIEADVKFHSTIANATHNKLLAEIYHSASIQLSSEFHRIYEDTEYFKTSQTSHEKLLKYIIAGDLKNVRKLMTIVIEEP